MSRPGTRSIPGICEADRVQHPDLGLGDPHRRVALPRERRHRLRDEGVERRRATSGAVSASRQPQALSSRKDRPLHAESLELAVDLDRTAVARAVAAGHRRLPGELRVAARAGGRPRASAPGRRRARRGRTRHAPRSRRSARSRPRRSAPAPPPPRATPSGSRAPPAGAPSRSERYGSGATPIPPPTSSGRSTSSRKPLPSGPRTPIASPGSSAAERARAGADRVDQERRARPAGARQRLIGRGSSRPGASSMKNCPGDARVERSPRSTPQERVRPDRLGGDDRYARSRLSIDPFLEAERRSRRARARSRRRRRPRRRSS